MWMLNCQSIAQMTVCLFEPAECVYRALDELAAASFGTCFSPSERKLLIGDWTSTVLSWHGINEERHPLQVVFAVLQCTQCCVGP